MPDTSCPSCSTPVEYPPELAGKRFFCMKCDHEFRLPGVNITPGVPATPLPPRNAPSQIITTPNPVTPNAPPTPEPQPARPRLTLSRTCTVCMMLCLGSVYIGGGHPLASALSAFSMFGCFLVGRKNSMPERTKDAICMTIAAVCWILMIALVAALRAAVPPG
jgi:hypothetical protein